MSVHRNRRLRSATITEQPGIPPADGSPVPPAPPAPPAPLAPPGYQQPGYQQPYGAGYLTGAPASDGKNVLGILSLIAPFVGLGLVGIILGHLGLSAVKKGKANNHGVALAGTVVSWVFTVLGAIGLAVAIIVSLTAAKAVIDQATPFTQFPTAFDFPTEAPLTTNAADPATAADGSQVVSTDTLFLGDCILDPYSNVEEDANGTSHLLGFQVVPCESAHYGEVFYVGDITLDTYDPDTAYDLATTLCEDQFDPYVGVAYDLSSLHLDPYYPSAESGAAGSREVTCVATDYSSEFTGSIEGSGL